MKDMFNLDGASVSAVHKVVDYMYRQIKWTDLMRDAEAVAVTESLKVRFCHDI